MLAEFFGRGKNPHYYSKLSINVNSVIQKSFNFIEKTESQRYSLETKFESVPANATIRKEYVNCGKYNCHRCPHGPYYYSYWKENSETRDKRILRKKYIGTNHPRMENNDNDNNNLIKHLQNMPEIDFKGKF
jgi:hypothetical protein